MIHTELIISSIIILIIGSVTTFFTAYYKSKFKEICGYISFFFVLIAALEIITLSIDVFSNGPISVKISEISVTLIGSTLSFHFDTLSAIFLCLIALISVVTTFYSIKFMSSPYYKNINLLGYYPPLLLNFASMIAVVSLNDMFFFFIAWEFMTLSSYALVIFDRKDKECLKGGYKYFLMTHIATACMFLAAIILYTQSNSFNFESLSLSLRGLISTSPVLVHIVLALFFVGFATKAGVFPFGDWLPDAYPAAPSGAASVFGGIMSKLGVYGIIRIFCDILPISKYSESWGIIIAIFATASIFIGTMTALIQDDTKKLLSFHVIGQIGYMLLGIGIGIYFLPTNKALATIAIIAGIFHLINNSIYKTSLFLTAGSIFYKTGTRDLNKIGGLSKLMPMTAIATVIASLSIAGVPPLNGFSSKWLIYQASIVGGMSNVIFIILGIIAIFISAVTLASFFKFFGASFFGKMHKDAEKLEKNDVPKFMYIPQLVLGGLCIIIGLFPMLPIKVIYSAVTDIFSTGIIPSINSLYGDSLIGINTNFGSGIFGSWNPIVILAALIITTLISYYFYKSGKVKERIVESWYCGEVHTDEEVRYSAHNFYMPFKQLFRLKIGKYEREGVYPSITLPKIELSEKSVINKILEIDKWFYYPLVNLILKILKKFSKTHVGIPHVYLFWMFIGLVVSILVLYLI